MGGASTSAEKKEGGRKKKEVLCDSFLSPFFLKVRLGGGRRERKCSKLGGRRSRLWAKRIFCDNEWTVAETQRDRKEKERGMIKGTAEVWRRKQKNGAGWRRGLDICCIFYCYYFILSLSLILFTGNPVWKLLQGRSN